MKIFEKPELEVSVLCTESVTADVVSTENPGEDV